MNEVELTEQLDQAIEAMLSNSPASPSPVDQQVAELLSVAAELRDLPAAGFKSRLQSQLEVTTSQNAPKLEQALAPSYPMSSSQTFIRRSTLSRRYLAPKAKCMD